MKLKSISNVKFWKILWKWVINKNFHLSNVNINLFELNQSIHRIRF